MISIRGGKAASAKELADKPETAATMLSDACMAVFEGSSQARSAARNLDFFAYGPAVQGKAAQLSKAILSEIGDKEAGDLTEEVDED